MKIRALLTDRRLIRVACVLVLASLAFTAWAVLDPRPLVVIAAMSVGQGIGIVGVLAFMVVVLRDLWTRLRSRGSLPAPPADAGEER